MAADPLDDARNVRELLERWTSRVDQAVAAVRTELVRRADNNDDRGRDERDARGR